MSGRGPALAGIRIVELAGKGPAPFGVMLLADLGADVIRVQRAGAAAGDETSVDRGRRTIELDLKQKEALDVLLRLVERSDVLVESFRPGVAERLGFGPDTCLARNPRLVYARVTGWGQEGPLAAQAAHDLNYLAVAGALHPLGDADRPPPPPLNLVGDYGGGGTYVALGVLAALFERERSGAGQVVDAAMVDGVASLLTVYHDLLGSGGWRDEREANLVDGGAPWYRAYRCADGRFVAVATLEPSFYALFLERLGLAAGEWPQYDRAAWPRQRETLAAIFATRTRDEWERVFEGSDACVAPVLTLAESVRAPQLTARGTVAERDGRAVPAPAPRLSETPATLAPPARPDAKAILAELGLETGALA
jgi:alpha-methylacyl-CoA racemase